MSSVCGCKGLRIMVFIVAVLDNFSSIVEGLEI